jgi:probable rRNA maturation factor
MIRVLLSRRIHRTLDPPLCHEEVRRRLALASRDLCGRDRTAQISLLLCSDRVIREINRDWLGRDRPTNVIAFPSLTLSAYTARTGPLAVDPGILDPLVAPSSSAWHLGDIAVSVDTALTEAGEQGRQERVVYLALHGLLHLLGWDHDDEPSWRRMHRRTLRLLDGR